MLEKFEKILKIFFTLFICNIYIIYKWFNPSSVKENIFSMKYINIEKNIFIYINIFLYYFT